jgi:3-oxoacyl-[acyl-carrier-protein] synthase-1
MSLDLFVVGAGAVTSVGFSMPSTMMSIRAGVDCFTETTFVDGVKNPLIGAKVPPLDGPANPDAPIAGGGRRGAELLALAIEEAVNTPESVAPNMIILLAPEASRPSTMPDDFPQLVLDACGDVLGRDFFRNRLKVATGGAMGICQALEAADQWLKEFATGSVVIAAYDSWLNIASIQHGLKHNRILTGESADGFVPGEAASAILLSKQPSESGKSLQIAGIGMAKESAHFLADEFCTGVAMGKAMSIALGHAGIASHEVNHRLTNLSGEEYFFSESAYAWTRVLKKPLPPGYEYELPASSIGEIGAAFGPLLLGYAFELAESENNPGRNTMIQISSDGEFRGAVITELKEPNLAEQTESTSLAYQE